MQTIVTHTSPDWDAIGACWLLQRYGGLPDAQVVFVNTGNPDPATLAVATAVVDTGREYDPTRLRFDHHHLPGGEANETCATSLVFNHMFGDNLHWLDSLIFLIYEGDTGKPGANISRRVGIHALLSLQKTKRLSDAELLAYGYALLDDLAAHLKTRSEAAASLRQHTVYYSTDGLVRGLVGAPQGATFAAFEDGARLVLFTNASETTVAVGAMRGGESQELNLKALVLGILNDAECDAPNSIHYNSPEFTELSRWYLHEAGFFAGRGTAKAPDTTPLAADFISLCRILDAAWQR